MYVFKKLPIVLYSVHWYVYMFIKRLILHAAVLANLSITAYNARGVRSVDL